MDKRAEIPVLPPHPSPTTSYWQEFPPFSPEEGLVDHRTTSDLPSKADTVIIGSGITGAAVAWNLLFGNGPGQQPSDGESHDAKEGETKILMLEARGACSGATGRNGGHTKAASYLSFIEHVEAVGLEEAKKIARLELTNIKAVHAFTKEHSIPCALFPCQTLDVVYSPSAWAAAKAGVSAMREAFRRRQRPDPDLHSSSDTRSENSVHGHPEPPLNPPDLDVEPEGEYTLLTREEVMTKFPVHDIPPPWPPSLSSSSEPTSHPNPKPDEEQKEDENRIQGGVLYFAGSLSAYALGIGILRLCLQHTKTKPNHFNLQTFTPATSIQPNPSSPSHPWTITTPRGPISARRIVLATNGYTAALLPPFQGSIMPVRGQVTAQHPGRAMPHGGCLPTTYSFIYGAGYEYMVTQQRGTGAQWPGDVVIGGGLLRTAEGGREECGVTDDGGVNGEISRYLYQAAEKYFGGKEGDWGEDDEEGRVRREWTGIMGFSPDGFPFVGEVPGYKGVWVSGGFNGNGMVMCWMCAKALVEMMEGRDGEELRRWFPESWRVTKERLERRFQGETL